MLRYPSRALTTLAFAGMLGLCLVHEWTFPYFTNLSYLQWYANAGPVIALATAAFGAAWGGLDRNPALVSANPLVYFGACLQIAGLPLWAIGAHVRSKNRIEPVGFEALPVLLLVLALTIAMLGWLVFIVPAQYFLFLIAGSLSRIALTSTAQLSAKIESGQVDISESPANGQGWWDASMRNKPVTLASAFGAALLYLMSLFLR